MVSRGARVVVWSANELEYHFLESIMKLTGKGFRSLFCSLCLLIAPLASAQAAAHQSRPAEIECVSGGVGKTERDTLQKQPEQYSFWLITAAKKTGAYLSGASVTVHDSKDQSLIVSCNMDGPWLYLALPVGRYEVETVYRETPGGIEQRVKKITTIHTGDHHQMLVYFEVPGT
jgi:hypothetical protein